MSQERTEHPSAKRLKDARKKGQIARSRDLALAAASVVSTIAVARLGGRLLEGLEARLARDLALVGERPFRVVTEAELAALLNGAALLVATLVGPIALAAMAAGVLTHGFQGGWNFSPGALTLNWSRLSPASGLKRFGLMQSGADTVKTLVIVTAIAWLGWTVVRAAIGDAPRLAWIAPAAAGREAWAHLESLLWLVAWTLGLLALGDYALQRYRLMSSLKMTKQEVRDEARQQDGSAEVKGRVRRIQREMARRRMMDDVARSTVVITNPIHYAVALEYRRGDMAAPVVRAKGRDHLAAAIKERARQHGVPIVENRAVAQALYKMAEIGDTIPASLFGAVAEVLAQLVRLKQLVL